MDQKSGEIIKKVPLSGDPNTLAVTKDGGRVFVAIHEHPGALDVIDTTSLERIKTIPMKAAQHDIYLTPDGKYVVAGSNDANLLTVVDVQTEQPVWEIRFGSHEKVLTMAIESGPDGSGRRIFVNLEGLHGFAVVDFATHAEVARIKLPDEPGANVGEPCHGIGVAPDGKTLWVNSKHTKTVFVYSLPDLKLLGHAGVGFRSQWLTFVPTCRSPIRLHAV